MTLSSFSQMPAEMFSGDLILATGNSVEAWVKKGKAYYLSTNFSVSTGTPHYILFETADSPVVVDSRRVQADGGFTYEVFRLPTASGGTPLTLNTLDERNLTITPDIVITDSPTVVTEGSRIDFVKGYEGQGNQLGGGVFDTAFGVKRILAANSKYLVKFTAISSTKDIIYNVLWHEGEALESLQ